MILLLLADGFEEIEALCPLDILRRLGADIKTVGITGEYVCGAHGITVKADVMPENVSLSDVEHLILPGGMPGASNLDVSSFTDSFIDAAIRNGGKLGAICAAPFILGKRGLLRNRRATCYPGFENQLIGADVCSDAVVTDGNITTARGMGVALPFAKRLAKEFLGLGEAEINKLSASIMEV